jgi:hypothetical protein
MKLRTAIKKSTRVFVQASCNGTPIKFQVSKKEALLKLSGFHNYLDEDLDKEENDFIWSISEGLFPFWSENDLILSFT